MFARKVGLFFAILMALCQPSFCATGTESASFLDIPVGAGPAALGGAYTTKATDAYAPVWNPAGLGFLQTPELAATHLSYLVASQYEFVSVVTPLPNKQSGVGVSAQVFTSGEIPGRNDVGEITLPYKVSYGAYTLAYGRRLGDQNSFGASGKLIQGKLADVTATAYAADFAFYRRQNRWLELSSVLSNVGSDMKFVEASAPLASHWRAGGQVTLAPEHRIALEGIFRRNKTFGLHTGYEWLYEDKAAWRVGFQTSRLKTMPLWSAFSTGLSVFFWGQEFGYGWVQYGDLGPTHYFSLVLRWSTKGRRAQRSEWDTYIAPYNPSRGESDEDLIEEKEEPKRRQNKSEKPSPSEEGAEYESIYELLNSHERKSLDKGAKE